AWTRVVSTATKSRVPVKSTRMPVAASKGSSTLRKASSSWPPQVPMTVTVRCWAWAATAARSNAATASTSQYRLSILIPHPPRSILLIPTIPLLHWRKGSSKTARVCGRWSLGHPAGAGQVCGPFPFRRREGGGCEGVQLGEALPQGGFHLVHGDGAPQKPGQGCDVMGHQCRVAARGRVKPVQKVRHRHRVLGDQHHARHQGKAAPQGLGDAGHLEPVHHQVVRAGAKGTGGFAKDGIQAQPPKPPAHAFCQRFKVAQ